jgi:hypothetical protein
VNLRRGSGSSVGSAYLDISTAPAEFRLAAVAASQLTPELRKLLNRRVRERVIPRAIRAYSTSSGSTSTGNRLPFVTARSVKVTQRSGIVTGLKFGGAKRLRGGLTISDALRPVEFGSAGRDFVEYRRVSVRGKGHPVRRRTTTAFAPRRRAGRVIWPVTYDSVAPMVLTTYTQAVYELTREGLD